MRSSVLLASTGGLLCLAVALACSTDQFSSPQDAGVESGADASSPCRSAHRFCDDFDGEDAGFPAWDKVNGSPTRVGDSVTPPNALSLVATAWENDGGFPYRGPGLEKQLAAAASIRCELDLKISSASSGVSAVFRASAGTWRASVTYSGTARTLTSFDTTGDGGSSATVKDVLLDRWKHVVIVIDGTTQTITVPPDAPVSASSSFPGIAAGKITINVDNLQSPSDAGSTVLFDDVVCD